MLDLLRKNVYWIGMAIDTQRYCDSCDACNHAKPSLPQPVPLLNTPIGRPWEIFGVDVLKELSLCKIALQSGHYEQSDS